MPYMDTHIRHTLCIIIIKDKSTNNIPIIIILSTVTTLTVKKQQQNDIHYWKFSPAFSAKVKSWKCTPSPFPAIGSSV